jgi:4-hydroxybenzoate polyprenyltransferase
MTTDSLRPQSRSPLAGIFKWGSFVKLSHTVFALPFALASMAVAARDQRGWPGWKTFGLIFAAMVCARTCAMAFNRIAERLVALHSERRRLRCFECVPE